MEERAGLGLVSAMTSFSLANDDQLLALTLGAHVLATLQLCSACCAVHHFDEATLISLLQRRCRGNTFLRTNFTSFSSSCS